MTVSSKSPFLRGHLPTNECDLIRDCIKFLDVQFSVMVHVQPFELRFHEPHIMWMACNFGAMLPNRTNRFVLVSEFILSLRSAGFGFRARVHGENAREGEDVSARRRRGNDDGRE